MFGGKKKRLNKNVLTSNNHDGQESRSDLETTLLSSAKSELGGYGFMEMQASMTNVNGLKSIQSMSFKEKMKLRKQMKKIAAEMPSSMSSMSALNSTFPPSLTSGAAINGQGAGFGDEKNVVLKSGDIIQQLQMQNEALSARCRKLEAQNIIAAAQMVDFLAVALGMGVAILTYFTYAKILFWLVDFPHFTAWLVKTLFLGLPYVYNKMNYGVIYRRFQVFAVFTIFLIRVKLVRWRASKFTKAEDDSDGKEAQNLSSLRGDTTTTNRELCANSATSHFGDGITEDDVWEANYEINARYLYSSILRLRGLWTKTAQYLSSRADFVPIAYVRELSKLQDEAPETQWADVQNMLSNAGILHKFSLIEEKPIASASIGQVHTARVRNSYNEVVIKVQHPHALTLLSDDFTSINIMAWIVGILEPEYKFFGVLMREWATEARKELDFLSEVDNLETAIESIEHMNSSTPMMTNHSDEDCVPFSVEIPKPIKALSSKRVMVMSFCQGKRVDDLEQIEKCKVPKEAIMNALAQTFAHMMYATDIFNGDPHPGNIFLRPGLMSKETNSIEEPIGFTIVLLDWGLAKRLPKSKRIGFCQMTYAAATVDYGLMMDGFKTLGLRLKRENVAEDMEGVRFMLRDMAPRQTARKRLKAKMKTDIKRSKQKKKGERVPVESKAYPGEFFFFVRTNELLHGLGSKLGVNLKYLDVLKPFAEKGLREIGHYKSLTNHVPDPLLSSILEDVNLKRKIDTVLEELKESGNINGVQVCVIKNDKVLTQNVTGNLGALKSHLKVRSDTIMLGFSVTKAMTATLANRMVEEGYIDLDEPICGRVWPSFCPFDEPPAELLEAMEANDDEMDRKTTTQRWKWKRSITLKHILTHTSGLWFATPSNLTIKNLSSCESCCGGFEYVPERPEDFILPVNEPGTECSYQYLSYGWLVAGALIGAYADRHGERITYEEIYDKFVGRLYSPEITKAGFRPCGGGRESHDIAFVETKFDISIQMKREAEAMGEELETTVEGKEGKREERLKVLSSSRRDQLLKGVKGREFILDPRIWNSEDALNANVPSAGGRFSAKGLAMFYHELGNGKILSLSTLSEATTVKSTDTSWQSSQRDNEGGQKSQHRSSSIASNNTVDGEQKSQFGLGYSIIEIPDATDKFAFGHSGVGGSIGFHHVSSNTSVGIMVNRAGSDKDALKQIVKTISDHLNW